MVIQDLPLIAALGLAFASGLASTLSPCVLPVLPTFLAWAGGTTLSAATVRRRLVVWRLAWFAIGLSTVFTAGGVAVSALGNVVREMRIAGWVPNVVGIIFILWGLLLLDVIHLPAIRIGRRPAPNASWLGAFGFGAFLALTWMPCIGPFYGGILTLAGTEGSVLRGTALLLVYSLGLSLPFIALGVAAERVLDRITHLARAGKILRRVLAIFVLAVGFLLFFGVYAIAIGWMSGLLPSYTPPLS